LFDRDADGAKPLSGDDQMFLSNLDIDPGETKNLRRLHPGLVDELATLASRWQSEQPQHQRQAVPSR